MVEPFGIDPVAFSLGDVAIRWYGINYLMGFLLFFPYIKFLSYGKKVPFSSRAITFEEYSSFMLPVVLGVIVGGRLLDFLFYNPWVLWESPGTLFRIWEGGMSIHGGVIGALLLSFLYVRRKKEIFRKRLPFLFYTDLMAAYLPLFLFTGRITNFINGELYGKETEVAWGVIFPGGGHALRHPTQLYEALTEGLILFFVINFLVWRKDALLKSHGLCTGLAMTMYSCFRFIIEEFKDMPDMILGLTMGQILSLVAGVVGVGLLWKVLYRKNS